MQQYYKSIHVSSHFWQSLLSLLPVLRLGTTVSVGSGSSTPFWLDRWLGNEPFPTLFRVCEEPNTSVARVLHNIGNLRFRRSFEPDELQAWMELLVDLEAVDLTDEPDHFAWHLESSGHLSTGSLYQAIAPTPGPEELSQIWNIKLPLKIRIFLWQFIRGRVPSGVEVLKRTGPGNGMCPLCDVEEDFNHIFFSCVRAQFLWSCLREVVACASNFPDSFTILQSCSSRDRRLQSERRVLSKQQDGDTIDELIAGFRAVALGLAPPLPTAS